MITLFFKYNMVSGYWVFSIILALCYKFSVFGIGSPFTCYFCVAGEMHIFTAGGCPNTHPVIIIGGGYIEWELAIWFHIFALNFSTGLFKFKVKVWMGETNEEINSFVCWRDERRRRNFFWERCIPRRRNKRKCFKEKKCRTWTKIEIHLGVPNDDLPGGFGASIAYTDTKYTDQDDRIGDIKVVGCAIFCKDFFKQQVYGSRASSEHSFKYGTTYPNKAWDSYRQDSGSWIVQMEAYEGQPWDGHFDADAQAWHDDPVATRAFLVRNAHRSGLRYRGVPLWNPNKPCCNPVCHTANVRKQWVKTHMGKSEQEARDFITNEFPNNFGCWNGNVVMGGHTGNNRINWLKSHRGYNDLDAKARVISEFPAHSKCWEPDLVCNGHKAVDRAIWLMNNRGMTEDQAKDQLMRVEFPHLFKHR